MPWVYGVSKYGSGDKYGTPRLSDPWVYGDSKYGGQDGYGGQGGVAQPIVVHVGVALEVEIPRIINTTPLIRFWFSMIAEREASHNVGAYKTAGIGTAYETEAVTNVAGAISDVPLGYGALPFIIPVLSQSGVAQTGIIKIIYEIETAFPIGGGVPVPETTLGYGTLPFHIPVLSAEKEPSPEPEPHFGPPWVYGVSKYGSEDHYGGHTIPVDVGVVSEVEVAYPILPQVDRAINLAIEIEEAFPIFTKKAITPAIGSVSESEAAQTVLVFIGQMVYVGSSYESETPQPIRAFHPIIRTVDPSSEIETARPVPWISGKKVIEIKSVFEDEFPLRANTGLPPYNRFLIVPINNESLSAVVLTLPEFVDVEGLSGVTFVKWQGSLYMNKAVHVYPVVEKLNDIVDDGQIVQIIYPPDETLSGFYFIHGVDIGVISVAAGLYSYDLDTERSLVGS